MFANSEIKIGDFAMGNHLPFVLIAGPCQMESEKLVMETADALKKMCDRLNIPLIFKSSFDKANRTSIHAERGPGLAAALPVFEKIKKEFGLPVLTDIHEKEQCAEVAEVVDVLQIPAFLCRQTDLLVAAAQTGRVLNIKKGQFLAPGDMKHVVKKCAEAGNKNVSVCERGVSFGYNTLVNDFRALPVMKAECGPVIFDATHSVQEPGGLSGATGGKREYVEPLARAALSIGVAGLFTETHPDPDNAASDGPNSVPLHMMEEMLKRLKAFDELAKSF